MAHPDDPELACGGTIAQWTKHDAVNYILVSSGDKGSWKKGASPHVVASLRETEAKKAARFLGVKKVIFLRQADGSIAYNPLLRIEIAILIRSLKPYTIVTHDPWRRQFHPDHRATGLVVIDAIMIARDWHFSPALAEIGLKIHRAKELLLTPTDRPNLVHDVSHTMSRKIRAIKLHRSQLKNLYRWEQRITQRARQEGQKRGFAYAEAFYKMRI